jgi:hypothetical protein
LLTLKGDLDQNGTAELAGGLSQGWLRASLASDLKGRYLCAQRGLSAGGGQEILGQRHSVRNIGGQVAAQALGAQLEPALRRLDR